jgi:ribosome maturation factor RimP
MSGSSRHGSARPSAVDSRRGAGGTQGSTPTSGNAPASSSAAASSRAAASSSAAGGKSGDARNSDGRNGGARNGGARNGGGRNGSASRGASRGNAPYQGPARSPGAAVDSERVASLLEPVIHALDMDLEGVRVTAAGRRRLLRLIIDADGGVSLDDIAIVSREVSGALDDSSLMGEQPYTLEVSSPGVDRPLTERRHWRRAIGRLVAVPLTAIPGEAGDEGATVEGVTVEGRITGASGDAVTLDVAGQSRQFGYGDLGPGKIKIEFAPIGAAGDDESIDDEDSGKGADEEGSDGY